MVNPSPMQRLTAHFCLVVLTDPPMSHWSELPFAPIVNTPAVYEQSSHARHNRPNFIIFENRLELYDKNLQAESAVPLDNGTRLAAADYTARTPAAS